MGAPDSLASVRRRYGWVASMYDWANLEGLLYADARAQAVELLELQPGARVLDVACGTGANFELVRRAIGPSGELIGVDATPQMLDQARARIARAGWNNVHVFEADVCELHADQLGEPFDAALCTLGLSVIPQWQRAWQTMLACVRSGGRVAVMDAGRPAPGARRIDTTVPRPLAWALERLFAADCTRRPWRLLERDTDQPTSRPYTCGWVTAAAGTKATA
jgi:demethylmenaquinone methyltransferase/2-methoxy-6-polyprenyl-1,4-benzoquinol methylase